ncbi:MAG: hypothetical protein ACREUQ_02755 [Burkholderiales bacterium]
MLAQHKTNTNIGVGLGIVLQIAGRSMQSPFGVLLMLAGVVAFIWGCTEYARGKGYSGWFGVLGLFSILGLIVLAVMPDKHKDAPSAT